MSLALLADRAGAAAFMLCAGVLLAAGRRARFGWALLLALGVIWDVALNVQTVNFPHFNFIHYYLGAKYPAPYLDTYRLVQAGLDRPQIGMRDLARPEQTVRVSLHEQRAYYIDLLRAARVPFDPLAPLDSLAAWAQRSGAIEGEARSILSSRLPGERIAEFRRDVRSAMASGQGLRLTLDYGYNGSPFYGLLRQADPTLHTPFGPHAALAGLAWQLLGVALIALLAGAVLGLTPAEQVAVAALIVAGQEFAYCCMPGLVFTELWAPVLLAAWALRRDRPLLAGAAIAFAGLLKLFPFLLLLAAVVPLARSLGPGASEPDAPGVRRRALTVIASCAAATLALGWLSLASGRNWTDFLHKITIEFQSGANLINSVSAAAALTTLGVPDGSPLYGLLSLAALAPLLALFWRSGGGVPDEALARRALVFLAATGWVLKTWLSYYAILPAVLLPWMARRSRGPAVAIAAGMAVAYLCPGFDDPALIRQPALHLLKLVPYLAAPAWLVWLELREQRRGRWAVPIAFAALALFALGTVAEVWRGAESGRVAAVGEAALAGSDPARALASFDRVVRLSPRDSKAQRNRAIALATLGRLDEASAGFARAVALAPGDAAAHDDYGRALLMTGRTREAAAQLERASALAPADVQVLFQLARARLAEGRPQDAARALARARELAPDEPAIAEALERLGAP